MESSISQIDDVLHEVTSVEVVDATTGHGRGKKLFHYNKVDRSELRRGYINNLKNIHKEFFDLFHDDINHSECYVEIQQQLVSRLKKIDEKIAGGKITKMKNDIDLKANLVEVKINDKSVVCIKGLDQEEKYRSTFGISTDIVASIETFIFSDLFKQAVIVYNNMPRANATQHDDSQPAHPQLGHYEYKKLGKGVLLRIAQTNQNLEQEEDNNCLDNSANNNNSLPTTDVTDATIHHPVEEEDSKEQRVTENAITRLSTQPKKSILKNKSNYPDTLFSTNLAKDAHNSASPDVLATEVNHDGSKYGVITSRP